MGKFSFRDCQNGNPIICDKKQNVYVLVPKEFGGGHIKETRYNGYGEFAGKDIYELVADWNKTDVEAQNKTFLILKKDQPKLDDLGGLFEFEKKALELEGKTESEIRFISKERQLKYFEEDFNRYILRMKRFNSFCISSDEVMREKFGDDFKREIGINIACYDEDNAALKYPVKITFDENAVYEDCAPSLSDAEQGWDSSLVYQEKCQKEQEEFKKNYLIGKYQLG